MEYLTAGLVWIRWVEQIFSTFFVTIQVLLNFNKTLIINSLNYFKH